MIDDVGNVIRLLKCVRYVCVRFIYFVTTFASYKFKVGTDRYKILNGDKNMIEERKCKLKIKL